MAKSNLQCKLELLDTVLVYYRCCCRTHTVFKRHLCDNETTGAIAYRIIGSMDLTSTYHKYACVARSVSTYNSNDLKKIIQIT